MHIERDQAITAQLEFRIDLCTLTNPNYFCGILEATCI